MPNNSVFRVLQRLVGIFEAEDRTEFEREHHFQAMQYLKNECRQTTLTSEILVDRDIRILNRDTVVVFEDANFQYVVDAESDFPLRIVHLVTRTSIVGKIENMFSMKLSLGGASNATNPYWCRDCSREHKILGLEVEFILGSQDEVYKTVFLRKCNDKVGTTPLSDSIGLDGSRVPIEIRNVNSNSAEDLYVQLMKKISKVRETHAWMKKNMPDVSNSFSTSKCGTHIHFFHPNIPTPRVTSVFTAIAMIVNDFDSETWESRLGHLYGRPFDVRGGVPWCRGNHASELRVLNSVHPLVIKFVIENFLKALNKTNEVTSESSLMQFLKIPAETYNRTSWNRFPEKINESVAFMIQKKIISGLQVKSMIRWLRKNYKPLKDAIIGSERR